VETPKVPREGVETHASRFVRGDNLPTLCADLRNNYTEDDFYVVSNKVNTMEGTMSPAAARGSNGLIGRNVLQTMTFMTPDEYERLQALNAWTGRSDLVGLRHIDEINQSAGRNLSFRVGECEACPSGEPSPLRHSHGAWVQSSWTRSLRASPAARPPALRGSEPEEGNLTCSGGGAPETPFGGRVPYITILPIRRVKEFPSPQIMSAMVVVTDRDPQAERSGVKNRSISPDYRRKLGGRRALTPRSILLL
jgi:hypothetical protein